MPSRRWRPVLALGIALALTPPASAHEPPPPGAGERELRAYETETLGPEHAAEHAAERRAFRAEHRRWQALSPAQRQAEVRRAKDEASDYAASTEGKPSRVGRWRGGTFELPDIAIHAALLPTGKVLFWGYPPEGASNAGQAALWDPSLGRGSDAFTLVPPPMLDPDGNGPQHAVPAPLYCAGQTLLPSGEVLVAGGNLAWPDQADDGYDDFAGLRTVFTFDPWSETWTRQPDLADGHWYPGQALLADGRTAILGGYSDAAPGGIQTDDFEYYSAAGSAGGQGGLAPGGSADRITGLYPHLFTIPNGDLLLAGPHEDDSAILPVWTEAGDDIAWRDLPHTRETRIGGTAVLRPQTSGPSWRVTQIGGYGSKPPVDGLGLATRSTETIDARTPLSGWERSSPLRLGRSYHNTVLLPDRSMVTVGGAIGFSQANGNYATDPTHRHRRVELLDPQTGRWRIGPAQLEDRTYHSTALLLPDGRIFSAGDDAHGTPGSVDTAEIYEPPYLFRGGRPEIRNAPDELGYAQAFGISTGGAAPRRAVLVAPGATTHASDMSQRVVPLRNTARDSASLRVSAPDNPGIAPPGWYMLFVMSHDGVPSVASWVQLS